MKNGAHIIGWAACAACLCASAAPGASSKWKKHGTKKGVTVYTRSIDGSDVHEVKGVKSIDAAPADVWDFISDAEKLTSITPELVEWKSLGSCGKRCTYVYQRAHHPLIKDRHAVVKMRWKVTGKEGASSYRRWFTLTKDRPLPEADAIPFVRLSGGWTLTPGEDPGTTSVVYLSHTDAGGKVPVPFMNKGLLGRAYGILQQLAEEF